MPINKYNNFKKALEYAKKGDGWNMLQGTSRIPSRRSINMTQEELSKVLDAYISEGLEKQFSGMHIDEGRLDKIVQLATPENYFQFHCELGHLINPNAITLGNIIMKSYFHRHPATPLSKPDLSSRR